MKKVVLKNLNLNSINTLLDILIPLSDSGTVYFKVSDKGIFTDSHNSSGTIIKSVKMMSGKVFSDATGLTEKPIKMSFYDGKKVKNALSFLTGSDITATLDVTEMDNELYAESMTINTPKVKFKLRAADPSLIEFANVPEESMSSVFDTESTDLSFNLTVNEISQIKKICVLDRSDEISIVVEKGDIIVTGSDDSFSISLDAKADENINNTYRVDKELFNLIDINNYTVYASLEDSKLILISELKDCDIVVTLHEEL